jgi:asparagine synthase (glutamine-hydrolysing)
MRVAGMSLRHRGPDDFGIYQDSDIGLVHTRLSIIDPSPAGHQPMVDLESGVVIVYNGEIYNHKALAKEVTGKKRISQTDTEVFLRLYLKYGLNCLRKLRGMFAFTIWDPRTKSLH